MMNRQKQRRLRRHPLIRFLRAIIRLGRLFFKPAKPSRRNQFLTLEPPIGDSINLPIIIEAPPPSLTDPDLTLGEILGLVQWKLPEPAQQVAPAVPPPQKTAAPSIEHSGILNVSKIHPKEQFVTVGELLELVQWQFPAPPRQAALSTAMSDIRPQQKDFSLN
jgi:hypothetical protein